jgi:hypothetical protein
MSDTDKEKLTHLKTHSATEFYIYSHSDRDMILHPGLGNIKLWANSVHIGNNTGGNLKIGGGTQNHAYTDIDHDKLLNLDSDLSTINNSINTNTASIVSLNSDVLAVSDTNDLQSTLINNIIHDMNNINDNRIYVKMVPNWGILTQQFISGNHNYGLQTDLYHITNNPALNYCTVVPTNGGIRHFDYPNKKILMVKYSIQYQSTKGNVNTFKSRLIKYINAGSGSIGTGSVTKVDETLYQGVDYHSNNDMNNNIMYNGNMIVILDSARESVTLETQYLLTTSNGITDLKCEIEVIEL